METLPRSKAATSGERRRARRAHRGKAFAALLLGAVALAALLAGSGVLRPSELRLRDGFFVFRNLIHAPRPPDDIVIVAIDEPSMQQIRRQWPWPRDLHAKLVRALHEAGAAVVGIDVLFVETTEPAEDAALVDAVARAGNVVLAEDFDLIDLPAYRSRTRVLPFPALQKAARAVASIEVDQDPDGFVRTVSLEREGRPAFGRVIAEAYRKGHGAAVDPRHPAASFHIPRGAARPVIVNYLGAPRTIKTVSYYQALDYRHLLPVGIFRDKIVLVGRSLSAAPELGSVDHFPYPFLGSAGARISGIEIHGSLIDTLLRERYLVRLSAPVQGGLFLLLLAAGAALLWRFSHWQGGLLFVLLAAGYVMAHLALFVAAGRVGAVVTPVVTLLAFLVAERVYGYAILDRDRRYIRHAFEHYVPPAVVNRLVESPDELNLNGEHYETTVLFTDLVGFTTLSEAMEPMALRRLLTEYFTQMVDAMLAQNGTLDKFIGDAMMCFFGVPVRTSPPGAHARQAVTAAWDMGCRLDRLNQGWKARGLPRLGMRIGINTGRVVAGNMGTEKLFNYTIMGDAVNLGARLESANKQYGTYIMMGESTFAVVGDEFDTRKLDYIRVKGKTQPVVVYELLGPRGAISPEKTEEVRLYEAAFDAHLARDFEGAIAGLDKLLALLPDTATDRLAAERLKARCAGYLEDPPGPDWDGGYTMQSK